MLLQLLKYCFLTLFLALSSNCFSQNFTINITSNCNCKAELFSITGSSLQKIDTININKSSSIEIKKKDKYPGFYRLIFRDSINLDFIAECSNKIEIEFNCNDIYGTLQIKGDETNHLIHQFRKQNSEMNQLEASVMELIQAEDSEDIKNQLYSYLEQIKTNKHLMIISYQEKLQCNTAKTLIGMLDPTYTNTEKEYLMHRLPLADSSVIHTSLYQQYIIDYFAKFGSFTQESFETNIDTMLYYCGSNKYTRDFTISFLLKLFGTVGPPPVFHFIIDKYFSNELNYLIKDISIKSKIELYRNFKPGNSIDKIRVLDEKEKTININKLFSKNKINILVFWDPMCDHCKVILPEMSKYNWKGEKPQIITIAIFENKDFWKKSLIEINIQNLNNYIDPLGWESGTLKELMVYKTPFILLVDKKGKFIDYDIDFPDYFTDLE
jgi:thiol-disulfide isomerase/thioredoxin